MSKQNQWGLIPYAGDAIEAGAYDAEDGDVMDGEDGDALIISPDEYGDIFDEFGDIEEYGDIDEYGDADVYEAGDIFETGDVFDEFGRPRRRRRRRRTGRRGRGRLPKLPRPRELARLVRQAKSGDPKARNALRKAPPGIKAALKVAAMGKTNLAFYDMEGGVITSSDLGINPKLDAWMVKAIAAAIGANPPLSPSPVPGVYQGTSMVWNLDSILSQAPFSLPASTRVKLLGFQIVISASQLNVINGLPVSIISEVSATDSMTINAELAPGVKRSVVNFFTGRLRSGAVYPFIQDYAVQGSTVQYPNLTVNGLPTGYSASLYFITPAHNTGAKLLSYM